MAESVFKGPIGAGSIAAKFLSDVSNEDSDLLIISYAPRGGGNAEVDQDAAAPGGFADVSVEAPRRGVLEVTVAIGHAADSGRLIVSRNEAEVHNEPIRGSVRWIYAVEAA